MSGGSSAPTQQNVKTETSNLPEYARPYFDNIMQRAQAESYREYTPYDGQRIADFNQNQLNTQNDIMGMQTPGQFGTATGLTTMAGLGSLMAGQYAPSQFYAQQVGMPNLNQYFMSSPGMVQAGEYSAPQMNAAQTNYQPNLNYFQMQQPGDVSAQQVNAFNMQGAQSGYRPQLQQYEMGSVRDVQSQQVGAPTMRGAQTDFGSRGLDQLRMDAPEQFGSAQAQQYMSPYVQNVMDVQKREAIRDAKQAQLVGDLGAARQGTYGGSRQLLAGLERERNLNTQLGDIEAKGLQAAYENAQQQFERDRSAGMQAGQANLNAGLSQQQLQTQTGLQAALANLSNEQQARVNNQAMEFQAQGMNAQQALQAALANQGVDVTRAQQNLAARLQTQQLGTDADLQVAMQNLSNEQQARVNNQAQQFQAMGMNSQQALQAALANQQMGYNVGQQNLASYLQTQGLQAQYGTQLALANLDARSQANVQNLAAYLQTQGMNAQQAMQAALANQQMGYNVGNANLQSALQTQQLGTQSGLQALLANQQYGLEAQRLAEQSRQFSAQNALAAYGQAGQMGQTLTNLGSAQQQADAQRLAMQQAVGAEQQAMEQRYYDTDYADFLRQRDYAMEQLGQYSNLLRGIPVGLNTTSTTYAPPPSMLSQVAGTGLGAASLYNMYKGS